MPLFDNRHRDWQSVGYTLFCGFFTTFPTGVFFKVVGFVGVLLDSWPLAHVGQAYCHSPTRIGVLNYALPVVNTPAKRSRGARACL
jgi:hypothetical protein